MYPAKPFDISFSKFSSNSSAASSTCITNTFLVLNFFLLKIVNWVSLIEGRVVQSIYLEISKGFKWSNLESSWIFVIKNNNCSRTFQLIYITHVIIWDTLHRLVPLVQLKKPWRNTCMNSLNLLPNSPFPESNSSWFLSL